MAQLQATDPDEGINAEVTYSLATTNQSNWFTINEDSGLITTMWVLNIVNIKIEIRYIFE